MPPPDRQTIDLFEAARPVREEWLPRDVRTGLDEVVLPRRSVLLAGHIGERVETVFGLNLDFIYSPVGGIPALVAEGAVAGEISVWWAIQLLRNLLPVDAQKTVQHRPWRARPNAAGVTHQSARRLWVAIQWRARALAEVTSGGVF